MIVSACTFNRLLHCKRAVSITSFIEQNPHHFPEEALLPAVHDCMTLPEWFPMACYHGLASGSLPDVLYTLERFCHLDKDIDAVLKQKFLNCR